MWLWPIFYSLWWIFRWKSSKFNPGNVERDWTELTEKGISFGFRVRSPMESVSIVLAFIQSVATVRAPSYLLDFSNSFSWSTERFFSISRELGHELNLSEGSISHKLDHGLLDWSFLWLISVLFSKHYRAHVSSLAVPTRLTVPPSSRLYSDENILSVSNPHNFLTDWTFR